MARKKGTFKKRRDNRRKAAPAPKEPAWRGYLATAVHGGRKFLSPLDPMVALLRRHQNWVTAGAFLLVLAIGLLVRLEDVGDWKRLENRSLYQGEALLTTFDGYFYLTLARDLMEGTYAPLDEKRAVPDYPPRPQPPPLLSVAAAGVAKLTGISLNWVGAVMPALLGVLLALPLFALGYFYGGRVMGLTAALVGVLSHYYVYRSSLGWFDTDCMIVTWALSAAYLFLRFGVEQGPRRYVYFAAGMVIYGLFLWWWDQAPHVATVVTLLPLGVALVFFYRPTAREALFFAGSIAAAVAGVLAWQGIDLPLQIIERIVGQFSYISKEVTGYFPNIGVSISEQDKPTLKEIITVTTDSVPALILAAAGLILLVIRKPKESLFLSVPVLLALLSFLFARRFLIFLAPITALGLGYLVTHLWNLHNRWRIFAVLAPALVIYLSLPAFHKGMEKNFLPKEPPSIIRGMDEASRVTENNAVVWAWWDHGYPLVYWARRTTVNDGSTHTGERSVYNGIPYTTSSYRLAANFMQFYVLRGVSGIQKLYEALDGDAARGLTLIKKVFAVGPQAGRRLIDQARLKPVDHWETTDDWLEYLFPPETRPVYLFVDWRLMRTTYWWYWFGSWDLEKGDGIHPRFEFDTRTLLEGNKLRTNKGVVVDLKTGILQTKNNKGVQLKSAFINDGKQRRQFNYKPSARYTFEAFLPSRFSTLQDTSISESVFNKLFIRQIAPPKYFRLVSSGMPGYQLWRAQGDRL